MTMSPLGWLKNKDSGLLKNPVNKGNVWNLPQFGGHLKRGTIGPKGMSNEGEEVLAESIS